MKYVKAMFALLLYFFIMLLVYVVHVQFFRVNVVLYSALWDCTLSAIATSLLVSAWSYFRLFSGFEKSLLAIVFLLSGFMFAFAVPTLIDRSLSFYILEKLQQRGGCIALQRFPAVFTEEYLIEHHLMDIRLTEQMESGTVVIKDGYVRLTERGHSLASFSRFFRKNLLPKQRLLMGKYTDVLTDPFRQSLPHPAERPTKR
jgi:hypothetical protein